MPGTFTITLDTTGPQGVALTLDAGNPAWSTDLVVDAIATTTDPVTTGYQVKIWGNVNPAANPNIQTTEGASSWITLTAAQAVTLSAGDGAKTISMRMRDDVWNESSVASDTITVDTTAPVVTAMSGPTPQKISEQTGKDVSTISWKADSDIQAYKVKVVAAGGSLENTGTQIPNAAGSTNVQGAAAPGVTLIAANTTTSTNIDGTDLKAASSGDGDKIVKVFVQDLAGNWSVA